MRYVAFLVGLCGVTITTKAASVKTKSNWGVRVKALMTTRRNKEEGKRKKR